MSLDRRISIDFSFSLGDRFYLPGDTDNPVIIDVAGLTEESVRLKLYSPCEPSEIECPIDELLSFSREEDGEIVLSLKYKGFQNNGTARGCFGVEVMPPYGIYPKRKFNLNVARRMERAVKWE